MSTSVRTAVRIDADPAAVDVEITDDMLRIILTDGREIAAPLAWFPRLRDASPDQRRR